MTARQASEIGKGAYGTGTANQTGKSVHSCSQLWTDLHIEVPRGATRPKGQIVQFGAVPTQP
jgi:hypothetical protein